MKAYLASPFFNKEQRIALDEVRQVMIETGLEVFSTPYDGIVLTKENDSPEMRKKVFNINVQSIDKCQLLVAIIDDFDVGTIFEAGYAYKGRMIQSRVGNAFFGELAGIPIIAYSAVPGRGLNLMLQQAVWGFANGKEQLKEQLERFIAGKEPVNYLEWRKGDFV